MGTNSPKNRAYFITINESAPCYDEALEIAKNMKVELYALIIHDKDIDENGQRKKTHKHLVLELVNPIAFTSMQKHFKGAHVEVVKYKKSTYQYLIHNSPLSQEKYQYELNAIVSNNFELVKEIITSEEVETFNEAKVLLYHYRGITTQYLFFKHFGLETTKKYWTTYKQLCDEINQVIFAKETGADLTEQQQELFNDYQAMVIASNDLPF